MEAGLSFSPAKLPPNPKTTQTASQKQQALDEAEARRQKRNQKRLEQQTKQAKKD